MPLLFFADKLLKILLIDRNGEEHDKERNDDNYITVVDCTFRHGIGFSADWPDKYLFFL